MKELVLIPEKKVYVKDGVSFEYIRYSVIINGIQLELNPADKTVKSILRSYYELDRKEIKNV